MTGLEYRLQDASFLFNFQSFSKWPDSKITIFHQQLADLSYNFYSISKTITSALHTHTCQRVTHPKTTPFVYCIDDRLPHPLYGSATSKGLVSIQIY